MMPSHEKVWEALDTLAARYSLTASGLAKLAGLDSTAFNRSKRYSSDGRPRWPSTESLAKVLEATGSSWLDFSGMMEDRAAAYVSVAPEPVDARVPAILLTEIGDTGVFLSTGQPVGSIWDSLRLPSHMSAASFAIIVNDTSMTPFYRPGTILLVTMMQSIAAGDRVLAQWRGGPICGCVVEARTQKDIILSVMGESGNPLTVPLKALAWMSRITWASQ